MSGLGLVRGEDRGVEVNRLVARLGGRVSLDDVLGDLSRRARRTWAPGLRVRRAWTWDDHDRRDPDWWPQGVSPAPDGLDRPDVVATTWYSKRGQGSRISLLDTRTGRYEHVLLVTADLEPVAVHAGGLVWHAGWLHVAATARGFVGFRLADLVRAPAGEPAAHGHRYLLPTRQVHRPVTDEGTEPLRYSFLSLELAPQQPHQQSAVLCVGEYGAGRRLVRWPLDDEGLPAFGSDGVARPLTVEDGMLSMQGAVRVDGRWHLSLSHGRKRPGTLVTGTPGAWRTHRWAMPMGPEDLAWSPSTDRLWTVTEHPPRRWVVELRRPR